MTAPGNDAPPFRVLFVCTANQCRSAMAEAIARHEVTLGLAAPLQFSSAGTHASPGAPATTETLQVISELGLDLSRHRARELTRPRIQAAGLVLTMTRAHIRFVSAVVPEAAERTFTLMQFWRVAAGETAESAAALVDLARTTAEHTRKDDIVDPVGRGEDACRACAARLRLLIRPVVGALAAAAWRGGAAPPRRRRQSTPMPAARQPATTPPPASREDTAPAYVTFATFANDEATGEQTAKDTGEQPAARTDATAPPKRPRVNPASIFDIAASDLAASDTAADTTRPAEDAGEPPGDRPAGRNGARPPDTAPPVAPAEADAPATTGDLEPELEPEQAPDEAAATEPDSAATEPADREADPPPPPRRPFARLNMFEVPASRQAATATNEPDASEHASRENPSDHPSDRAAGNT